MASTRQPTRKPTDKLKNSVRRPDIRVRQVGFDVALYDPAKTVMHLLNPVAAAIWHHITPGRTLDNIVDALLLSFNLPKEKSKSIEGDVQYALQRFEQEGLLIGKRAKAPGAAANQPEKIGIPDREVSAMSGYTRPSLKTFTVAELDELFALNRTTTAPFADLAQPTSWPTAT